MFTDVGDVVIDPVAGSGVTLLAAEQLGRKSYGFEIKKEYVKAFNDTFKNNVQITLSNIEADRIKNKWKQMALNRDVV
jgi:site-specific DNA-methyltransferase (adenine-specific)